MSLEELRRGVDDVDARLVRLLAERLKLSREIGAEKARLGKSLTDASREAVVMERIRRLAAEDGVDAGAVESVYRRIIAASKGVQGVTVAFQGEPGAYSQQAAFNFFGPAVETRPYETLEDVFSAVERGAAGFAVVPVENSTEGVVSHTMDMFLGSNLKICAEIILEIHQCLLSRVKSMDQIKRVYAHYQALAQTRTWLRRNLPGVPVLDAASTSESAKLAAAHKNSAAIASAYAGEFYGLKILADRIEDQRNNFTRFLVIGKQSVERTGKDLTMVMFSLKDRPGALFNSLQSFSRRKINLTKIESRPLKGRAWEYVFFVEMEGHVQDRKISDALKNLEKRSVFVRVLGSFPKTRRVAQEVLV